jgi:hypothetical protein
MKLGRALSTFGKYAALRLGSDAAARGLLRDLASDDENVRMLAGMFLVKNGRRSLPILREALARREQLPTVLTILGDIATPECEELIRPYVDDRDPEAAESARMAMDVLRRSQRRL